MESVLLDAAGHRRSPATLPGYHRGRPRRPNAAPPAGEMRGHLMLGASVLLPLQHVHRKRASIVAFDRGPGVPATSVR
jgi:hypothetical protein